MIPLFYFLIVWIAFLAFYALMGLMSVYQLMRFGIAENGTWTATITFCTVALLAVIIAGFFLIGVDWTQSLNIFGLLAPSPASIFVQ